MRPEELYGRIREIAKVRYGVEMPKRQAEVRCLQMANNKLAILRDLCLKVGIKLISQANR